MAGPLDGLRDHRVNWTTKTPPSLVPRDATEQRERAMTEDREPAKVAFLIISDDQARAVPGIVMATRMKVNRGVDVRVLFFGPAVRLAASGHIDTHLAALRDAGIGATACRANVEQYDVIDEISVRPLELLAAGAEVEAFAREGYTVVSF